ncbi:MAG: TonB-dependent receptor, partial [Bacteroidaceae bacterium]|nr:TonB-dependent receptor [Bacteroidaceae bacterium]
NHSFSLGAEHRWSGAVASVRGFYHRGTQMIDWVMYAPDDIFHTASFDLDNVGVQVQGKMSFPELLGHDTWVRSLSMGYTYIHQTKHDAEGVVKSNMAMEYLRHKAVASFTHRIARVKSSNCKWLNGICELTWDFRWQERVGSYMSGGELVPYHPYAMLDAKLQWKAPRYQVFVQATNITNHRYYDLGSVPQPGIWVMAGARFRLSL